MASERKVQANRENAKRSTGPRTTSGRASARRNSLRHGLAVSIADLGLSAEAEHLARMIAGDSDTAGRWYYARIAAEAEMEILRIRKVKTELIRASLLQSVGSADPTIVTDSDVWMQLLKIDRYERRALSRRKRAFRDLSFA
jgi:hypothetical protein